MLKQLKQLEKLCTPALLYFVFSIVAYVAMLTQNFGNKKKYCFGPYECNVPNTGLVFFGKSLYILFFTWLLNVLCKKGYSGISWFLVFLPIILMFLLILSLMAMQ